MSEDIRNTFIAFSGASPGISTSLTDLSYTSLDGKRIYLNFQDIDSTGIEPATGLELRFSITKKFGSIATTVNPSSTFIDASSPKTLQLILSDANRIVDYSYNGSGVALTAQTVFVSYDATGFGSTVAKLSDNDTQKSFVSSFTGVGITNLTKESNPPVFNYSTTSTDGTKVFVYYTEATPPLLPTTNISGFAVSQNNSGIAITNGYVLDPTSATNGKIIVLQLSGKIDSDDGTNPATITYNPPASDYFKIKDSTGTGLTYAVAFSGLAITNLVSDISRPVVINAQTSVTAPGVFLNFNVTMSEPTIPGTSATGFSIYHVEAESYKTIDSITDSSTTYNGFGVTQYALAVNKSGLGPNDTFILSYTKPTSDFITDQSGNLNELLSFSSLSIKNLYRGTFPLAPGGGYSAIASTTSYVSTTGYDLYLDFNLNKSYPAVPGVGITGFTVLVDGQSVPVKNASTGSTGSDHNVKLSLYNKVSSGSSVEVAFQQGSLRLYGASGYAFVNDFEPTSITNLANYDNFGFFDPIYWNNSLNNNTSIGYEIEDETTDIFVKSEFYPNASVIYDTNPPKGILILNRKADDVDPGIKVHYFSGTGYSSVTTEFTDTTTSYSFSQTVNAFKIVSDKDQNISTIYLKLKKTGSIINLGDRINVALYTHDATNDTPSTLLGSFASIQIDDLTTSFDTYSFTNTGVTLALDTIYWVHITLDNLPIASVGSASIDIANYSNTSSEFAYYNSNDLTWIRIANTSPYYKITAFNTASAELLSKDYLLDIFEVPLKEVSVYGGSSDLSKYEVIGNEQANYVYKKFEPVYEDTTNSANNIYPTVTNLIVGATAKNTKTYILQIKKTKTSEWEDIVENIADSETTDYLNFTFTTPLSLYAARIAYHGDYFTIDQRGDITLAAYDQYSDVVSAQISRFSDFRDATSFPNADAKGFIDFSAGETTFTNIDLTNAAYLWSQKTGNAASEITAIAAFNDKILIAANHKMYVYKSGEVYEILNESLIAEKYQITCIHVYNGRAYAGTNYGLVFTSYNGEFWSVLNAKDPLSTTTYKLLKPIVSMASLGNNLFLGSTKGSTSSCSVYQYNGKAISELKTFTSYNQVSAITAKEFTLYVGVGGDYGSRASAVYKYYNAEWVQTLSSNFDNIECMTKSVTRNSVLVGFRGGQIWELSFTNATANSWAKLYDTYSDHIFTIFDDPNGNYIYVSTDNGTYGYFKSISNFKKIVSYSYDTNQLNATWRSYTGSGITWTDLGDIESYNFIAYRGQTQAINYTGSIGNSFIPPTGFTNISVTFEGAVLASKDGALSFRVDSGVGYNLFVNDTLQISNYNQSTTLSTLYSTNAFNATEGDVFKIKLQTTNNVGSGTTFKLLWQKAAGETFEAIPSSQFYGSSKVKSVTAIGNTFYGAGMDGSVYEFTTTPYENNSRYIYARFKDEAGNIQGVALPAHTNGFPVINDRMIQVANTANNTSSFIQYTNTTIVSNSNTTISPVTGNTQNNQNNNQTQGQTNANTTPTTTTNTNTNNQNLSTTNNSGVIYQIQKNADNSLSRKGIYVPPSRTYPVYAPDRKIREYGIYEVQPIYVPTLITWSQIVALILNKYPSTPDATLDNGTQVKIYVKTGNTRAECIAASYGDAQSLSSINDNLAPTTAQSLSVDLSAYSGKWLQYKVELITATPNVTPELLSLTISYTSSTGSYFFTRMFDTTNYDTDAPMIKRGLLTSNELKNNGSIVYGYTTSSDTNETFNFANYTVISPNQTFELSEASSKIRFGIFLTSVGTTPSMVYDFAVQLDIGDASIKFNPTP
jgi:hypothetical protein